jgi:hypothetical protein
LSAALKLYMEAHDGSGGGGDVESADVFLDALSDSFDVDVGFDVAP